MRYFILLFLLSISIFSKERLEIYYDIGSFNKGYKDLEYVNLNDTSFATLMWTMGINYHNETDSGIIFGGGIVNDQIIAKKVWNFSQYEEQPGFNVIAPYSYIGYNFGFWGWELGVSCYLTFTDFDDRLYYNQDGSTYVKEEGGYNMDRSESHVYINFLLRILPKDWLHFELRFGRGRFSSINSLLTFAVIYPFSKGKLETYFAFKTPKAFIDNQGGILRSNQSLGFIYELPFESYFITFHGSYLVSNVKGVEEGKGSASFLNKFSGGIGFGVNF